MAKVRKDSKGRVLHKGETYKKNIKSYCFSYTDPFGKEKMLLCQRLAGTSRERKAVGKG